MRVMKESDCYHFGSYGSLHKCNITCFISLACQSKTSGLKIHMESAIDRPTKVLCGLPRDEETLIVPNPGGKPTCLRCLKILGEGSQDD